MSDICTVHEGDKGFLQGLSGQTGHEHGKVCSMCLMRFIIQQQDLEFLLRREVNIPSSVSSVGSAMFPNGH